MKQFSHQCQTRSIIIRIYLSIWGSNGEEGASMCPWWTRRIDVAASYMSCVCCNPVCLVSDAHCIVGEVSMRPMVC
jgi:hypothetical protein